jgi:hypothetical protein
MSKIIMRTKQYFVVKREINGDFDSARVLTLIQFSRIFDFFANKHKIAKFNIIILVGLGLFSVGCEIDTDLSVVDGASSQSNSLLCSSD